MTSNLDRFNKLLKRFAHVRHRHPDLQEAREGDHIALALTTLLEAIVEELAGVQEKLSIQPRLLTEVDLEDREGE